MWCVVWCGGVCGVWCVVCVVCVAPHLALEVGCPASIVAGTDRHRPFCLGYTLLDALVELIVTLKHDELAALRQADSVWNREGAT